MEGIKWKHIVPDENNDWINKKSQQFTNGICLIGNSKSIFKINTNGLFTSRDSYIYNFSKKELEKMFVK